MKRMKTFLIYALILIGFFAFSLLLENGLLMSMYKNISGNTNGSYEGVDNEFGIENVTAQATNINGNIQFDLVNNSGKKVEEGYLKIDLYNSQSQNALTQYIPIKELKENESKTYRLKFKANNIEDYDISVVKDIPDKTNILDIMGWEIDLSNVFGLGIDLTNLSIFGNKLPDLLSKVGLTGNGIKGIAKNTSEYFRNLMLRFSLTAAGVPPWAYLVAMMYITGVL